MNMNIVPRMLSIELSKIGFNEPCDNIWSENSDEIIETRCSTQADARLRFGAYSYLAPSIDFTFDYFSKLGYICTFDNYKDPLYGSKELFRYKIHIDVDGEKIPINTGEAFLSDLKSKIECLYSLCVILKKSN